MTLAHPSVSCLNVSLVDCRINQNLIKCNRSMSGSGREALLPVGNVSSNYKLAKRHLRIGSSL